MSIKVNNKLVTDLTLSGKHIRRVMLNDQRIWPDEVTENFELILDIDYNTVNPNNGFVIELLEMFDSNYNKIDFTNIERIGNPSGDEKPLNTETIIYNDETRCSIMTDFGLYNKQNIPAYIEPEPGGNNYAYAWLPDSVGVCGFSNKGSGYLGYRYTTSINNTPAGDYSVVVNSEGTNPVKYLAFTPGYSGAINALTWEIYHMSFRGQDIFNYSNRAEFRENEMLTVDGVNWKARYIVSTTGEIYKCWHRNWYNTPSYLGEMYLCKIINLVDKNNNTNVKELFKVMVPATLKDIVTKSDKQGNLNVDHDINSIITFSSIRGNISSGQSFHAISAILLYDKNNELINKEGLTTDLLNVSNIDTNMSKHALLANTEQDVFLIEADAKLYSGRNYNLTTPFGYFDSSNDGSKYVFGVTTTSISNTNSRINYTLYSNKEINIIALPLIRLPNWYNGYEFFTKLIINNSIIKDYGDTSAAADNRTVGGKIYGKRFFYKIDTQEIFVSYALANQTTKTIDTFRAIYVYDNFKKTMDEITIEELLTGKYIDGEYDSFNPENLFEYSFTFRYPIYDTTIYYTALQYLSLLNLDGTEKTKMKEIILDGYLNGRVDTELNGQFKLENDETMTVVSEAGVYSTNYLISKMFNPGTPLVNVFLTGYLPNDNTTLNIPRKIKFYFQTQDYFLLFLPFWYYPSSSSRPYTSSRYLHYDNNNEQILKDYPNLAAVRAGEYRTVKGLAYYRKILASYHKAYIVFTRNPHDISPLYKYNEEFDSMIEVNIKDIVDNDLVDENIETPPLDVTTGSEFYLQIARPMRLYDATQTGDYIPIRNGVIWIDDGNGGFKKVASDSYIDVLYKTETILGTYENDFTSMQRFKDNDGNIYEITTDNGTYANNNNYLLWNILSSINKSGSTTQYGYLGKQNPGNSRFFKFNFKSTITIKALVLTFLYQNDSYNFYEGISKLKYKEQVVFDYNNYTETASGLRKEGYQAKFVFFPDKDEFMKVFTPTPSTPVNKHIDSGLYLWNRNNYEYVEFSIEELYSFNKDNYKYNFEDASYEIPEEFANQLEFYVGSVVSQYNNNTYNSMGNCLLFDENNEIINLTFVSQTRNNSSADAPYGDKYHTTVWRDDQDNIFKLIQNGFAYSTTKSAFPYAMLTPATNTMLVNTNNSNASQDFWYTREGLKSAIDTTTGEPNKLCHMRFIAKTRKIGAIAISETCNHSYSNGYVWYQDAFSHIYFLKQDNTKLPVREKNILTDLVDDYFLVANSKRWLKRRIILANGEIYITWIWYNKFTT